MPATAIHLFAGTPVRIDDEGQFSAIWKQPVTAPVAITHEGLVGDAQADRRVHGGPEKAVHHYAAENYARLATRFPAAADQFYPGSIGENLSTSGFDETAVCIGDLCRIGTALLQVSQPRSPCWKIDHRYGTPGITAHIVETGLTGWYYRVMETGQVAPDSTFEIVDRPTGAVPLLTLWQTWHAHRPDIERLAQLAKAPGLTASWVKKLGDRMAWLAANAAKT